MGDRLDFVNLVSLAVTALSVVTLIVSWTRSRKRIRVLTQKVAEVRHHNTGLQHEVQRLTRQLAGDPSSRPSRSPVSAASAASKRASSPEDDSPRAP